MAVKLQTFKDISSYLSAELSGLYSEQEIKSIVNIIYQNVFGTTRSSMLMKAGDLITDNEKVQKIKRYCKKLKSCMPVEYVTGETWFFNCLIKVKRGVLIPRPETEELVDIIIKENKGYKGKIIDIGTGSGCIAIALSLNFPDSQVIGIDNSRLAIRIASENAKANNAVVNFIQSDIFNIASDDIRDAGIIVSNPPYVLNSQRKLMKSNVLDYEPHKALFVPDNDPLRYYRAILALSSDILIPGGSVYFEINEILGKEMLELLLKYNFRNPEILKDLNGKDRFAKGIRDGKKEFY